MNHVCLFDPGIEDNQGTPNSNLGAGLIQEAILRELKELFPGREIRQVSAKAGLDKPALRTVARAQWVLVGGNNILTSHMRQRREWVISFRHAVYVRRAILMGVGWWQYQDRPDLFTRLFLYLLLSRRWLHSVRDSYTRTMLGAIGFRNALNTACPSMWPLLRLDAASYPTAKAPRVLTALTDYAQDREADQRLLDHLAARYEQVFFWPQGKYDLDYIHSLRSRVVILERSLAALHEFLDQPAPVDYVGTRLHCGIHCLCQGRRSLILEVDNRAKELSKDTGLPTAPRHAYDAVAEWIGGSAPPRLRLDAAAIQSWKAQFAPACCGVAKPSINQAAV